MSAIAGRIAPYSLSVMNATRAAREAHPERWSGNAGNWNSVEIVSLNPERAPETTPVNKAA